MSIKKLGEDLLNSMASLNLPIAKEYFSKQIRFYIKHCCILGTDKPYLMKCVVFRRTIDFLFLFDRRWWKKFKRGVDSVKAVHYPLRPETATSPKKVNKVKDANATDAKFRTGHKAQFVCISVKTAYKIFRHYLELRRISSR